VKTYYTNKIFEIDHKNPGFLRKQPLFKILVMFLFLVAFAMINAELTHVPCIIIQ
jgi:hypothetical protein